MIDRIAAAMTDYATKAAEALAAEGRPVENTIAVAPGVTPAWDSSCSQLYGRVVQVQPVVDKNIPASSGCLVSMYVVNVALAVTRCVKTMEPGGRGRVRLPSADQVEADGFAMLADLAALEQVIRCNPRTRTIVSGQPLPEMGGMAGFEWVFTMRVLHCGCPPEV